MAPIPLLRASWVEPFFDYFRDHGAPIDLCLQESAAATQLPGSDVLCPSRYIYSVIDRVIAATGNECEIEIGRKVCEQTGIRALGDFGRRVTSEPTLGEAIRTATRLMPSVHSARTLELSCRGGQARLASSLNEWTLGPALWEDGFVASMLIDLVRLAAGADWHPDEVRLQSPQPNHRSCRGVLGGATIRYGQGATMIEFPAELMERRLRHTPERQGPTVGLEALPADFVGRVQLVLEFLLRQAEVNFVVDVNSLAALIGTSSRSLQRHLRRRGQSFTGMLERTRKDKALLRLEESAAKVIDVAFELGYTDSSHFARAFRRWTGVTPKTYQLASL